MKRHGIAAVPHGFRSSFRDWAAEKTDYPREVIEAALAHVVRNKVEAACAQSRHGGNWPSILAGGILQYAPLRPHHAEDDTS